jgi:hypothetical protein
VVPTNGAAAAERIALQRESRKNDGSLILVPWELNVMA